MAGLDIHELNDILAENGRPWWPRKNAIASRSDDQIRAMLGAPEELEGDAGNFVGRAEAMPEVDELPPRLPQVVDWRNYAGKQCVTPVKNQMLSPIDCQMCTSFAVIAVTESMVLVEHDEVHILSEADLHFCSPNAPMCHWWKPGRALGEMAIYGACAESVFPYLSAFHGSAAPRCNVGPDRDNTAVRISSVKRLYSINERKEHLSNNGPCIAMMAIYSDFLSYGGNVYRHVAGGGVLGTHTVAVIGYSDLENCWLCKNSWGTDWGALGGFFKIGYGEAEFDSPRSPFYTAQGTRLPKPRVSSGTPPLIA